jgi:hypothetical protein
MYIAWVGTCSTTDYSTCGWAITIILCTVTRKPSYYGMVPIGQNLIFFGFTADPEYLGMGKIPGCEDSMDGCSIDHPPAHVKILNFSIGCLHVSLFDRDGWGRQEYWYRMREKSRPKRQAANKMSCQLSLSFSCFVF